MNEEDYETTDPASEIATLFSSFADIPPSSETTLNVLSNQFNCDPATSDWYELLGAMAARISSLRGFVMSVEDRFVRQRMRKQALTSLDHMAAFLRPDQMNKRWDQVKLSLFTDQHISHLESFAAVAEKYRPLRKLSNEERENLVAKLQELLSSADLDLEGVPPWAAAPLKEGVQRLCYILQHFSFFGHQTAIDALLNLAGKVEAVAASDLSSDQKRSAFEFARKTMHMVFFVGELLLLPANTYQGYQVYKDLALEHFVGKKDEKLALVNDNANQKAITYEKPPSPDVEEVIAP